MNGRGSNHDMSGRTSHDSPHNNEDVSHQHEPGILMGQSLPNRGGGVDSSSSVADPTTTTKAIAMAETRVVRRWKALLLVVLVVSMVGVAMAVYFYTSNAEQEDFEAQFHNDARIVLESIGGKLARTLGSVDAFVVNIVVCIRTLCFLYISSGCKMRLNSHQPIFLVSLPVLCQLYWPRVAVCHCPRLCSAVCTAQR
jgi:hypothetical protein